jgi:hypothetical protein
MLMHGKRPHGNRRTRTFARGRQQAFDAIEITPRQHGNRWTGA